MYKESKIYSLAQAIVNLIVSLILIRPLGIIGVLLGTVISDWLIIEPFNIVLIYNRVFKRRFNLIADYLFLLTMLIVSSGVCIVVSNNLMLNDGWGGFVLKSFVVAAVAGVINIALLYVSDKGFRRLVKRFVPNR